MKLWNWFLTKLGRRFPLPPRHILNYEEISKYWDSMSPSWQGQCNVLVLRIRKSKESQGGMILKYSYIPSLDEIRGDFPSREPNDPFTIRIDRAWELHPGIKTKEEVCIANFEL